MDKHQQDAKQLIAEATRVGRSIRPGFWELCFQHFERERQDRLLRDALNRCAAGMHQYHPPYLLERNRVFQKTTDTNPIGYRFTYRLICKHCGHVQVTAYKGY